MSTNRMEETIQAIQTEFSADFIRSWTIQPNQYAVEVKPESIKRISQWVFEQKKGRLMIINASRIQFNKIELAYIWSMELFAKNFHLLIRTWLPMDKLEIESITAIGITGANFLEREVAEMVGITFNNHPTPYRIHLPYEWPPKEVGAKNE